MSPFICTRKASLLGCQEEVKPYSIGLVLALRAVVLGQSDEVLEVPWRRIPYYPQNPALSLLQTRFRLCKMRAKTCTPCPPDDRMIDTASMRFTTLSLFALFALATVACSHSARYYVDRGNARSKAGKYEEAWLEYRKAIQKDPRAGEAYYRAGLVAIQLRKGNDAYQALRTAEDMLPERDDVKVTLGNVVLEGYLASPQRPQKLYDDLTRIAQDLLSKNPNSFDGLRFQAAIAVTDGKLEQADELYRKANTVRPMQPEVVLPWVQALLKAKRYQDAEKVGFELIHEHKDVGQMYRLLYAGFTESNRPAEAENILKLQIANNPRDANAVLELARHYERQQRISERDSTLKILLDNRDRFPQAEANIGDYYAANRNWNEAYREYS